MEVLLTRLSRHRINLPCVELGSWVFDWRARWLPGLLVLQSNLSVQVTQSCFAVTSWHLLMPLRQFVLHANGVMITSCHTWDRTKHRTTIAIHHARLEAFTVVNHLLVVKHAFAFVITWPWVPLSSFLLDYIKYSSSGTLGKLWRSYVLLWWQLLLLRYGLVRTWTWHVSPL